MKKISFIKDLSILLLCSTVLTSCMNDVDLLNISNEIKIDESLVLPIGEANMSLEEILANQKLMAEVDSQGLIISQGIEVLFQDTSSVSFKFREIDLAGTSQKLSLPYFVSPVEVVIPPNTNFPTINSDNNIDLGINSQPSVERIDSVRIGSATLGIKVTVTDLAINPSDLKLILSFPDDRLRMRDGSSNAIHFSPKVFGQTDNVQINNFVMKTSGGVSELPIRMKIDFKSGNQPLTVGPASKIEVELKFNKLDFEVAYGLFQPSVLASSTIQTPIEIGSTLSGAVLKFANPTLTLTASSNIGTYLRFKVDYVRAFVKENPTQESKMSFDGKDSEIFDFSKPKVPGDKVMKVIKFDKNYGSTDKLFENDILPNMLEYKFSALINKEFIDNDPTPNYITPDGKIDAKLKIEIPFYLNAGSNFELKDTIENVGKNVRSKLKDVVVEKAVLVMKVMNGLPVKAKFTMILLDSLGATINSSIEKNYDINSPMVDNEGLVTTNGITPQTIQIELTQSQIEDLKRTKKIAYLVRMDGKDSTSKIHLTKLNTFSIKLGIFVKGSVTKNLSSNN